MKTIKREHGFTEIIIDHPFDKDINWNEIAKNIRVSIDKDILKEIEEKAKSLLTSLPTVL